MNKLNIYLSVSFVFFTTLLLTAQEKNNTQEKDSIVGSEVVNIVKAYSPTISDAFKVKESPSLNDENTTQKEPVQYHIFSFPVASTFTPSKGKSAGLEKEKTLPLYDNYTTLGFGNYPTINAEVYLTKNISRNNYLTGMLRHLSSQGGINDLVLDDKYATTGLDITYGTLEKNYNWSANLGAENQIYNWYGLPTDDIIFTDTQIATIDEKQNYNSIYLNGNLQLENSVFTESKLNVKYFFDALQSSEIHLVALPKFNFDVMEQKIQTNVIVDYVSGNFDKNYTNTAKIEYNTLALGLQPSILYQENDVSVQLGASVFFASGKYDNQSDSDIFIYPNIKASYKLVGDILTAYAGATGGLQQNTYANFVTNNKFVSPTLSIAPTDEQYNVYLGLKGKLSSNIGFTINGRYKKEKGKPLFINNMFIYNNTNTEGYTFGNSFGVIYDDISTLQFSGGITADWANTQIGITAEYNNYTTDKLEEAWNLPQLKTTVSLNVALTDKWSMGGDLFFVGERKDKQISQSDATVSPPIFTESTYTLKSYFDINANVKYQFNQQLSAFLKGNNLANQNNQRWINYPVQGIQVLLGANYKFNF